MRVVCNTSYRQQATSEESFTLAQTDRQLARIFGTKEQILISSVGVGGGRGAIARIEYFPFEAYVISVGKI